MNFFTGGFPGFKGFFMTVSTCHNISLIRARYSYWHRGDYYQNIIYSWIKKIIKNIYMHNSINKQR